MCECVEGGEGAVHGCGCGCLRDKIKVVIIVPVPINVLHVKHIMFVTLFLSV